MMRFLETVWLVFFLLGLLTLGVLGTWAETAPFWYGAALLSVAGAGALLSRQGRSQQQISWTGISLIGLMALYLGWRAFTSEVRWMARQDLVFGGTALVVYLLMATRFTTTKARAAVMVVLFILVTGNTALGLYQYYENPRLSVFSVFGLKRAAEVSAGGFFESGNHLAGFLTLAGLPMLGLVIMGKGMAPVIRVICALGFLIAGTGVSFSTSRGGVVGFFTGVAVLLFISALLWLGERKNRKQQGQARTGWWILGSMIAFAALIVVSSVTLKKFFGEGKTFKSLNGREVMWDAALEQWQTSPIIGTGARSYEYMERGFRTANTQWFQWGGEVDAVYAHNDYLQCLGDYGLAGLGLVLLATAVHVGSSLRLTLKSRSIGGHCPMATGLVVGGVGAIAGGMIQALVEFNLHIGINAVMTGMVLGILATPGFAAVKEETGNTTVPPRNNATSSISGPRLAAAAVAAAISILLIESGWRLAPADYQYRKARHELKSAVTMEEFLVTNGTLQRATSLDPDNCHAWELRGKVTVEIATRTNKAYANTFFEAALSHYDRSLELYPKNPYAAAEAGNIAGYLGKNGEAETYFKTALRWGITVATVNELYGHYLFRRGQYLEASRYLIIALHWNSDPVIRTNLDTKVKVALNRLKYQETDPPEDSPEKTSP